MTHARWAILGAGAISGDFARALPESELGRLHAVGARDQSRAEEFAAAHGAPVVGTYDEILGRDDIDAVYIGTVHTTHTELVHQALAAGKAVLCEKPLGVSPAETDAAIHAARAAGLPLVEAFKYRFGPFADRLREIVGSGALGDLVEIESSLGFAAGSHTGRLFDPATAGGAILDVGCYPLSLVVGVAAWSGRDLSALVVEAVAGTIGETGVDVSAAASIDLGGATANIRTAIVHDLPRLTRIVGRDASLEIPNVWGSRTGSTEAATLIRTEGTREEIEVSTVQPMAAEADATIRALRDGRTEVPEVPWEETRTIARLLAAWRGSID
ncbi:Gfo/Idh/MocA family oxidoreductase [Microbacterium oleivorans]|uniref:Gfo/Idh/MocA family protein n=1 Tax=Microbacterium oleivorans TaxID=273677 RepID=UPI0010A41AD7|nr:Gfo/Idh/MocA family oxidoreductase [Microbacterium oleivorans]THE08012.1 Gfo/Idh/MocA family oxidoreductase [Microbacterium oleivorans]